jgi:hypothetical protein
MPMTAVGISVRNAQIRMMTSRPFSGLLAKLAAAGPDKIQLKDYSVERGDPVGIAAEEAE